MTMTPADAGIQPPVGDVAQHAGPGEPDASVLCVVNTGAVVSAAMVERLFQLFTRLDDRTRHEGFGLGSP